ncbi:MAG: hypothetical protein ACM3U2_11765 [Deltaproteobacteria bacterium]
MFRIASTDLLIEVVGTILIFSRIAGLDLFACAYKYRGLRTRVRASAPLDAALVMLIVLLAAAAALLVASFAA